MTRLDIPRAADLRPTRRGVGGKAYIGPKVQMHVPGEHYDFVLELMEARGWGEDRYAEALREVFAAGVELAGARLRGEA